MVPHTIMNVINIRSAGRLKVCDGGLVGLLGFQCVPAGKKLFQVLAVAIESPVYLGDYFFFLRRGVAKLLSEFLQHLYVLSIKSYHRCLAVICDGNIKRVNRLIAGFGFSIRL